MYFKQAVKMYGQFDYVIDLHRDGVGNVSTSVIYNSESYAKMMFVISEASAYYDGNYNFAKNIMKVGNHKINGIYKNINRKYYTLFNQDLFENIYLIEMGSNNNTFLEVERSLEIFVESFIEGGN